MAQERENTGVTWRRIKLWARIGSAGSSSDSTGFSWSAWNKHTVLVNLEQKRIKVLNSCDFETADCTSGISQGKDYFIDHSKNEVWQFACTDKDPEEQGQMSEWPHPLY